MAQKNCMRLRLRREIVNSNVRISLFERSIKNLNLSDFSYNKQVDGQIRVKETKLDCMKNWN